MAKIVKRLKCYLRKEAEYHRERRAGKGRAGVDVRGRERVFMPEADAERFNRSAPVRHLCQVPGKKSGPRLSGVWPRHGLHTK